MKLLIAALLLGLITEAYSAPSYQSIEREALQDYEAFKAADPDYVVKIHQAIDDLKAKIKSDKSLRQLIKRTRKDKTAREDAQKAIIEHFDDRGVRFGMLIQESFLGYHIGAAGLTWGGGYESRTYDVGPGIGFALGDHLVACVLEGKGSNIGLNAKALVLVGVTVGTYVGRNGVCVVVGYGAGIHVSAGVSVLSIRN